MLAKITHSVTVLPSMAMRYGLTQRLSWVTWALLSLRVRLVKSSFILLLRPVEAKKDVCIMAKTPAWTRKEGKNPKGGLNAKGRASYNAANPGKPGLKRPQPEGGSRRDSFCARMKGMKKKLTSAKTANDPDSAH
jgi:hypothetical protein